MPFDRRADGAVGRQVIEQQRGLDGTAAGRDEHVSVLLYVAAVTPIGQEVDGRQRVPGLWIQRSTSDEYLPDARTRWSLGS